MPPPLLSSTTFSLEGSSALGSSLQGLEPCRGVQGVQGIRGKSFLQNKQCQPLNFLLPVCVALCHAALCTHSVFCLQAVLDVLERPYYQQLATGEQASGSASQGLRCATALRRLLHPANLLPKQPEVTFSCMLAASHVFAYRIQGLQVQ